MANHYSSPPPTTKLFGFYTLIITTSIFLFLSGLTFIATIFGLVLFFPFIVLFSPIWLPLFIFGFIFISLFLSTCGFALLFLAALTWAYRCFLKIGSLGRFGSVRIHHPLPPRRAKLHARENVYEEEIIGEFKSKFGLNGGVLRAFLEHEGLAY
ncbi:hypothetical protein PIB30_048642 [Stylosanthes scabra]|uniref:Uncharacterized protein n=1 Tax=Stylosanthes scabra TaxID=79078 RepID=A0ABU6VIP7_9FABA|nr:hypothetical protein [Stylosanthes scabra]